MKNIVNDFLFNLNQRSHAPSQNNLNQMFCGFFVENDFLTGILLNNNQVVYFKINSFFQYSEYQFLKTDLPLPDLQHNIQYYIENYLNEISSENIIEHIDQNINNKNIPIPIKIKIYNLLLNKINFNKYNLVSIPSESYKWVD